MRVELEKWSDENPLPRNMDRDTDKKVKEDGDMVIDDKDPFF